MDDVLRDEIIADITEAFDGVRRGEITIHEANVIDDYGSEAERRAARARDTEKRWQDVPDSDIEFYPSALSFLCPKSFRYYVAAYMVWSLRYYRTCDSISSDFTIYAFSLDSPNDELKLSRFALFSPRQANAIRRFLEFMVNHGDGDADDIQAKLALDAYWNRFGK